MNINNAVRTFTGMLLTVCFASTALAEGEGRFVVTNRGSESISVVTVGDVANTVDTINLGSGTEPIAVIYTSVGEKIWVGDRANSRVLVYAAEDLSPMGSVATGAGIFHMASDKAGRRIWVVNDVSNTATVIDARTQSVITTVSIPSACTSIGGKPHDVVLDPRGRNAYISCIGTSDSATDLILQFDARNYALVNTKQVGKDPHITFNSKNRQLYVPAQSANAVYVLDAATLDQMNIIPVSSAHGVVTVRNSKRMFVANIANGGTDAVFSINTRTDTIIDVEDTAVAIPHNLAVSTSGETLIVTHSGASADKVSLLAIDEDGQLSVIETLDVGTNPFGVAHVPGAD